MKTSPFPIQLLSLFVAGSCLAPHCGLAAGRSHSSELFIARDPGTGTINLSWVGGGSLKQSPTLNGTFKPVRSRGKSHQIAAQEEQMIFQLESAGPIFSVNIVGYINTQIPPGLSLVANQLWNQDNNVALLIHNPPDGAQ